MKLLSTMLIMICLTCVSPFTTLAAPIYSYKIVHVYPHDPNAFTQGLVFDGDTLYEGTGLTGESSLRRIALKTGKILKIQRLSADLFGEGIAVEGNRIIQLTWQSGRGFVYDKATFRVIREFKYETEGWGLTYDGRCLIMSDGTNCLRYLNKKTFAIQKILHVAAEERPIFYLNELEYIRGEIFANVWGQDSIARISPETGQVLGWIDLSDLRKQLGKNPKAEVMNGIAYHADRKTLFVTGKYWPKLFEIEILGK